MSGCSSSGKFTTTLTEEKNDWCDYPRKQVPEITYEWDWYTDYKRPYEESFVDNVLFKHGQKIVKFKRVGEVSVYVNDKDGERFERWYKVPEKYYWNQRDDCVWIEEYETEEYDLKTLKVRKYKMVLESENNMSQYDLEEFGLLKKDDNNWASYQPMTDEEVQEAINKINKEKETNE